MRQLPGWAGVLFLTALATIVLLLLSLATFGPFDETRVGTAGEWFAGLAAAAVLLWAVAEPIRTAKRDRGLEVRQLAMVAISKAIDFLANPFRSTAADDMFVLGVAQSVVENPEVQRRLRVTGLLVGSVVNGRIHNEHFRDLAQGTAWACYETLVALVQQRTLPSWEFTVLGLDAELAIPCPTDPTEGSTGLDLNAWRQRVFEEYWFSLGLAGSPTGL